MCHNFMIKLEIEGERITLRKLRHMQKFKDKEMVKWTLTIPWPYKKQDAID